MWTNQTHQSKHIQPISQTNLISTTQTQKQYIKTTIINITQYMHMQTHNNNTDTIITTSHTTTHTTHNTTSQTHTQQTTHTNTLSKQSQHSDNNIHNDNTYINTTIDS